MRKTVAFLLVLFLVVIQSYAFAETQYDTGHFTLDIPDGWMQYEAESLMLFYGKTSRQLDGRIFGVREFEVSPITKEALLETYKMYVNATIESDSCLGLISDGVIEIDGGNDAYYYIIQLDQDGTAKTRLAFLYYGNGNIFQAIYENPSADDLYEEFVSLIDTLRYIEPTPVTVHHFGSRHVAVKSWKVIYQYDTPCLLIEYEWYHTEDEPIAFMYSFSTEVYQDGVQCYPYIWLDGEEKDTLKIQKNTKLTCYEVFLLSNDTSPVTLYVDEIFDFSDRYEDVIYQFDIAR